MEVPKLHVLSGAVERWFSGHRFSVNTKNRKNVNRKVCKFGCFVPMPHRTSGDVMYHGHGRILNGYSSENCWDTFGAHPARRLAAEKYVPRERRIVSLIFEAH